MIRQFYQHLYFFPRIFTWTALFLPTFFVLRIFVLAYWAAETDFETICKNISHPPRQAVFLLTTEGDTLGEIDEGIEVAYSQLPKVLVETLILEEDSTFWENKGFNSLNMYGFTQIHQSSLSSQVARQMFHRMGVRKRNFLFFIERYLWLPLMLERNFTKTEILTLFCNEISWDWKNRGIAKACEHYFHKKVENLNLQEIALLMAIEKNPIAKRDTSKAFTIRNLILENMAKYDIYPRKWKDSLQQNPLIFYPKETENGMRKYLINAIKQDIEKYQNIHYQGNIYENGFAIKTTISSNMQKLAETNTTEMMTKIQSDFEKGKVDKIPKDTAEMIEVMKETEYWQQRKKWGRSEKALAKDIFEKEKSTIFTWQGEIDSLMSPYEAYLYEKMFQKMGFCVLSSQTGHILAYIGGANQDFFKRDNVLFAHNVGIPHSAAGILSPLMDLHKWEKKHNLEDSLFLAAAKGGTKFILGLGLPLPSIRDWEVSLHQVMGAYTVLANQGKYTQPTIIQSIIDKNDNKTDLIPATWQAISPTVSAKIMNYMENKTMQDYGTGFEFVAKYGLKGRFACQETYTNSRNEKWFIAIKDDLVLGTWIGSEKAHYQWNNKDYHELGENVIGNYLRLLPSKKVKGI